MPFRVCRRHVVHASFSFSCSCLFAAALTRRSISSFLCVLVRDLMLAASFHFNVFGMALSCHVDGLLEQYWDNVVFHKCIGDWRKSQFPRVESFREWVGAT